MTEILDVEGVKVHFEGEHTRFVGRLHEPSWIRDRSQVWMSMWGSALSLGMLVWTVIEIEAIAGLMVALFFAYAWFGGRRPDVLVGPDAIQLRQKWWVLWPNSTIPYSSIHRLYIHDGHTLIEFRNSRSIRVPYLCLIIEPIAFGPHRPDPIQIAHHFPLPALKVLEGAIRERMEAAAPEPSTAHPGD